METITNQRDGSIIATNTAEEMVKARPDSEAEEEAEAEVEEARGEEAEADSITEEAEPVMNTIHIMRGPDLVRSTMEGRLVALLAMSMQRPRTM